MLPVEVDNTLNMCTRYRARRLILLACTISFLIYLIIQYQKVQMAPYDGWDPDTSRVVAHYVVPNTTTTLLRPDNLCESPAFLMIIACSAPTNFEKRNAIRESWGYEGNVSEVTIKVYFLLGKSEDSTVQREVEMETELYKDIIQEDFMDTYLNLTLKSLMLLKLVKYECKENVKFVMKTDDDMFINVVPLIRTLLKLKSNTGVLLGYLMCNVQPVRDFYDKWYAPEYMYSGKIYPNYLSGSAYVMSADVPEILFDTALQTPLFHLEDVYITGICTNIAKLKPRHNKDFHFRKITFNPCIYKSLITAHYFKPIEMRHTHYIVQNTNLEDACRVQRKGKRNESILLAKLAELQLSHNQYKCH